MSTLSVNRIENVQVFDFANTAFVTAFNAANAAYVVSNSAFAKANAALANTSGVSFAGDLYFPTGNVGIGISSGLTRNLQVQGNVDAGVKMSIGNSANGTGSFAQYSVDANGSSFYAYSFAGNYTSSGRYIAGSGVLEGTGVAGLNFVTSTATGNVAFWTGASPTEKMRISSAGNIGVGNTNPQSILHVASGSPTVTIEDNTSAEPTSIAKVSFKYNSGELGFVGYDGTATGSLEVWNQYALGNVLIGTNNTERVRVTRDGNIGIGTASPTTELQAYKTKAGNVIISVGNSDSTTGSGAKFQTLYGGTEIGSFGHIWNGSQFVNTLEYYGGWLAFNNQGVERMRFTNLGRLGIGSTNPIAKVHATSADGESLAIFNTSNTIYGAGTYLYNNENRGISSYVYSSGYTGGTVFGMGANSSIIYSTANAAFGIGTFSVTQPLIFGTSGSERMRITSGGDVMINQTSSGGTGKLGVAGRISIDMAGSDSFSGQLYLNSGYDPSNIQTCGPSSNGMSFWTYVAGVGWNERMRITGAGNVGIGTTTPNSKLEVYGKLRLSGTESNQLEWVQGVQTWKVNVSGSNLNWYLYDSTNNKFPFTVQPNSPSDSFFISANGVGIGTASPSVSLDVGGRTDAIRLPVGTTAQRPAGANGHIRFNSTTSFYEIYDGPSSSWQSLLSRYNITYMIVAGGGGGGSAGGGGGGGYIAGTTTIAPATSLAVTVGAGGNPATTNSAQGGDGGSSSLGSLGTAIGGGGGGSYSGSPTGRSGGSGGGAGWPGSVSGGSGTAGQGNAGGSNSNAATPYTTGGGGGAAAVGGNNTGTTSSGSGGAGIINSINGSSLYWAGGGGGGAQGGTSAAGNGGIGGGGGGANYAGGSAGTGGGSALNSGGNGVLSSTQSACVGGSGGTNTGGGGGGMGISVQTGGTGGSGIVIIRYPGPQRGSGGTVTSSGGNTIHTFTTSGTFIG